MLGGKTTILYGENSYERTAKLAQMKKDAEKSGFEIQKQEIDGLSKSDFVNLICGISLLAEKRFVYIRNLSENFEIWQNLGEILPRISTDVHLCVVEDKIDKRSTVYKSISKIVEIYEFKAIAAKDSKNLAEFARAFGKKLGLKIDNKTANFLISWVGLNEWSIRDAIEKMALIGEANEQNICEFVPQNVESNAFAVFEMMLSGDISGLQKEISKLKITDGEEGAYKFLGLISTQVFNFSALKIGKSSGKTTAEIAKEIGANSWALGRLDNFAQNISNQQLTAIVSKISQIDEVIKSENVDVWAMIESTLIELAIFLNR